MRRLVWGTMLMEEELWKEDEAWVGDDRRCVVRMRRQEEALREEAGRRRVERIVERVQEWGRDVVRLRVEFDLMMSEVCEEDRLLVEEGVLTGGMGECRWW